MSPHGGMVADLSVQVIDLNVRGCLLYRRRTREISERSERFLSSSLHLFSARKRVSGTKGHAATVFDKGHYHLLPCLSGSTLRERSLGPITSICATASAACGLVSVILSSSFFMARSEGIGCSSLRIAPASHREARIGGARTRSRLTMMGRF
jgi:hypothetical protein